MATLADEDTGHEARGVPTVDDLRKSCMNPCLIMYYIIRPLFPRSWLMRWCRIYIIRLGDFRFRASHSRFRALEFRFGSGVRAEGLAAIAAALAAHLKEHASSCLTRLRRPSGDCKRLVRASYMETPMSYIMYSKLIKRPRALHGAPRWDPDTYRDS